MLSQGPMAQAPTSAQSLEALTLLVEAVLHDQTGLLNAAIAVIDSVTKGPTALTVEQVAGLSAARDDIRGLVDEVAALLSDLASDADSWEALAWEHIAMQDLVADAVEDYSRFSDHVIVADLAPVTIFANAELVSRSVRNLIGNTLRHTPSRTTVQVTLSTDGDNAEVIVADDGPGIPDPLKDHVFQPFFHVDGWRGQSGLGLGLSLVRASANLHGGDVEVRDRAGGGAEFVLRIPIRDTSRPLGTVDSSPSPDASAQ